MPSSSELPLPQPPPTNSVTGGASGSTLILLRADATPAMGVGHAMRLLALSQEARARGMQVVLAGDLSIPWVASAYHEAGIEMREQPESAASLLALADALNPAAVVLDGYHFGPEYGRLLRSGGHRVGAMIDGHFGGHQIADVYIDQNPGSPPRRVTSPEIAVAGAEYTLFRDDVLAARARRQFESPTPTVETALRVLSVFGGTDPLGAAPVVAPLIARAAAQANRPVEFTVVSHEESLTSKLSALLPAGSTCQVIPAVSDLADRAAQSDLVITASGSTVWELLCIGVPTAVVCVIDNQTPGYEFATEGNYVAGLGHLANLRACEEASESAVRTLHNALMDVEQRTQRSNRGMRMLDGDGRTRVLDVLLPTVSPSR